MRNVSEAFSPAITLLLPLGECCDTGAFLSTLHVTSNVVIQPMCAHKCINEKAVSSDMWALNRHILNNFSS